MSKIYENLYLGSAQDAEMMKDVDLVINCTPDVPFYATKAHHIRLPVQDNGNPRSFMNSYHPIIYLSS